MQVCEARQLRHLEEESRKLKHLVAELTLDDRARQKNVRKKLVTPAARRSVVEPLRARFGLSDRRSCRLASLSRSVGHTNTMAATPRTLGRLLELSAR